MSTAADLARDVLAAEMDPAILATADALVASGRARGWYFDPDNFDVAGLIDAHDERALVIVYISERDAEVSIEFARLSDRPGA